jgi:hypothetical protein
VTVVLAAVSESRSERLVDDLWSRLDPEFLTNAGWDPQTKTLAPQPDHPLLGSRRCRVQGCRHQPEPPDGLCPTCGSAYRISGMSVEEFLSARQVRKVQRGEVNCVVGGCSRPCRNNRMTLCPAHDEHRKRLNLSPIEFVNHPAARALPGLGPCSVPMCDRQAKYRRGAVRIALCTVVGSTPQRT